MKRIFFSLIAFFSASFLSAQTASIRLGVLKGISCVPCAYLIENRAKLSVQNMTFKTYDSVQGELPALLKDELDMGFLSPKDAAKVFNKGGEALIAIGVCQNGNAYLITNDEAYSTIENLAEKTVVCEGNDSDDVAVLNHILSKDGSGVDSVEVDFSVPLTNIANKLIIGEEQYALLKEPFATVALAHSSKIRRAESLQKMYSNSEEASHYPAMLLVARADFASSNAELVRRFIELYKYAVSWTNKNPSKAGLLSEKHKLGLKSLIVKDSIPNAAIVWRDATMAKNDIEKLFEILEVQFPEDAFYFNR